jgi:hypothetical protein
MKKLLVAIFGLGVLMGCPSELGPEGQNGGDADAGVVHSNVPDAGDAEDGGPGGITGPVDSGGNATPDAGNNTSNPDAGGGNAPDAGPFVPPDGVELNPGWIGGACDSATDCTNPDPICETSGFSNGFCTEECSLNNAGTTWVCPDTDYGDGTLNTITRCIDTGSASAPARCVAECDFEKSPSGCRTGYTCVLKHRYNQPTSIYPVCLPADNQAWPGATPPANDIGDACSDANDCESLYCLDLPGGFCTKSMCDVSGCPAGSTCFGVEGSTETICLQDCTSDSQCRTGENYFCEMTYDICWPDTPEPVWDPSVGVGDCADAWSAGLSSCDTVPDDYVVVNKTNRNLALCNSGSHVANYNIGLGFAPLGDKNQEGDGKTPEGVFYIPRLVPQSSYYKAFLLSYPDTADATRGLSDSLISQAQHDEIVAAQNNCTEPPQYTPLGGLIEIHGHGGGQDWTFGCIAVENTEVDALWDVLAVGDTIVVLP